jgi:hypothetical protein
MPVRHHVLWSRNVLLPCRLIIKVTSKTTLGVEKVRTPRISISWRSRPCGSREQPRSGGPKSPGGLLVCWHQAESGVGSPFADALGHLFAILRLQDWVVKLRINFPNCDLKIYTGFFESTGGPSIPDESPRRAVTSICFGRRLPAAPSPPTRCPKRLSRCYRPAGTESLVPNRVGRFRGGSEAGCKLRSAIRRASHIINMSGFTF